MPARDTCPDRETCGPTGHRPGPDGKYQRCACLQQELRQAHLGVFYHPDPVDRTPLREAANRNLLIEGPLNSIRPHVARILLDDRAAGRTNTILDAYRLVDIFLEKDDELHTIAPIIDADRAIILLGFGDVKNQRLPDLILQVLARRDLLRRPTWVILGLPRQQISVKYNSELADKLETFKKVGVK